MIRPLTSISLAILVLIGVMGPVEARVWNLVGSQQPIEAEFVGLTATGVVLKGANGVSKEFPHEKFTFEDQRYILSLAPTVGPAPTAEGAEKSKVKSVATLTNQSVKLEAETELHITGEGDPISGSSFSFMSPDGWLFFDNIPPSVVIEKFLKQMRVYGRGANLGTNVRITQYGQGSVVIPHASDFPAMAIFPDKSFGGDPASLKSYVKYNHKNMKGAVGSFRLKRGYMATIAKEENGTGPSKNYVAQDQDLEIDTMPAGLDKGVGFVRIFPWRWTSKKGIGGAIWKDLNCGWFYDWNIGAQSSPDIEYVAIKHKRYWPGLDQDWKEKGINHLLGYNEPNGKDQANMSVGDALASWPDLLGTGLRLGSPAPTDGGLGWLYEFMDKADAAGLRVDFVALHYYRAINDPNDAKGAANQMYQFIKGVHDRTKRPIWITEWNNGANWTTAPDPNPKQQEAAIAAMIKMLDETPFVERYAPFNWVEDCRQLVGKNGDLTGAGEVFREKVSPVFFTQPKSGK